MKVKDLRNKSDAELGELLRAATKKIAEIQFNKARSRPKNVKEMRELRRMRARIMTLRRERSL